MPSFRLALAPLALSFFLAELIPTAGHAQRPLNLGFETPSVAYADRPWGWSLGWSAFTAAPTARFVLDESVHVEGTRSLRIVAEDSGAGAPSRELMLQVPADFARGKELRLTGMIRTDDLAGRAFITLEAWGDRVVPAADSGVVEGGPGIRTWQEVALSIRVPSDPAIHSIVLIVGVRGAGTAWFDALALSVDGAGITLLPPGVPPATPAEIRWLTRHSAALRTFLPPPPGAANPPDDRDLALFDSIVGGARVVGLGESTHGTSEFFEMKHRLVEHLVRTQGFDLFAVEANQLAVERLNAFVLGGPGETRDAMRVMFRVWNTEEMQALVDWMRNYNASHPARPVRFIGYDMQDHQRPVDSLLAFVARTAPALRPRVEGLTAGYRAQPSYSTPQLPDSIRGGWLAQADTLAGLVAARRSEWLSFARGPDDSARVEWAVHEADLYRQAARLNASLNSPDRDSLMAGNLAWALRTLYPNARVIVWAHDVHVSHGGDPVRSFNGGAQMGAQLKQSFGLAYVAFSLLTAEGQYSATRSFTDHVVIAAQGFPAPAASVEGMLSRIPRPAGSPGLTVDLRVPGRSADGAWLWRARPLRHIGYAAYDYGFDLQAVMPLEFDGIVFIERSTASRMLP